MECPKKYSMSPAIPEPSKVHAPVEQVQQQLPPTAAEASHTAAHTYGLLPGDHTQRDQLLPGARITFIANLSHRRTGRVQALHVTMTVDELLGPPYPNPRDNTKHMIAVRVRDVQYSGTAATDYKPIDPARVELRLDQPRSGCRYKGYWWLEQPAAVAAPAAAENVAAVEASLPATLGIVARPQAADTAAAAAAASRQLGLSQAADSAVLQPPASNAPAAAHHATSAAAPTIPTSAPETSISTAAAADQQQQQQLHEQCSLEPATPPPASPALLAAASAGAAALMQPPQGLSPLTLSVLQYAQPVPPTAAAVAPPLPGQGMPPLTRSALQAAAAAAAATSLARSGGRAERLFACCDSTTGAALQGPPPAAGGEQGLAEAIDICDMQQQQQLDISLPRRNSSIDEASAAAVLAALGAAVPAAATAASTSSMHTDHGRSNDQQPQQQHGVGLATFPTGPEEGEASAAAAALHHMHELPSADMSQQQRHALKRCLQELQGDAATAEQGHGAASAAKGVPEWFVAWKQAAKRVRKDLQQQQQQQHVHARTTLATAEPPAGTETQLPHQQQQRRRLFEQPPMQRRAGRGQNRQKQQHHECTPAVVVPLPADIAFYFTPDPRPTTKQKSRSLMVLQTGRETAMSRAEAVGLLGRQRQQLQPQVQAYWLRWVQQRRCLPFEATAAFYAACQPQQWGICKAIPPVSFAWPQQRPCQQQQQQYRVPQVRVPDPMLHTAAAAVCDAFPGATHAHACGLASHARQLLPGSAVQPPAAAAAAAATTAAAPQHMHNLRSKSSSMQLSVPDLNQHDKTLQLQQKLSNCEAAVTAVKPVQSTAVTAATAYSAAAEGLEVECAAIGMLQPGVPTEQTAVEAEPLVRAAAFPVVKQV